MIFKDVYEMDLFTYLLMYCVDYINMQNCIMSLSDVDKSRWC